jgi:Protein of unknown function (DUF3106)
LPGHEHCQYPRHHSKEGDENIARDIGLVILCFATIAVVTPTSFASRCAPLRGYFLSGIPARSWQLLIEPRSAGQQRPRQEHSPHRGPQAAYGSEARTPHTAPTKSPEARPPYSAAQGSGNIRPRNSGDRQVHLGTWLTQHENMSPAQQQEALRNEPGFDRLSPQSQQNLMDRLAQINSMPPPQRQRMLAYIEAWGQLSPQRQQRVRTSLEAIRSLTLDRQRMLKRAIRDLREHTPGEREAIMASSQFRTQFTFDEQNIISDVVAVEPYVPRVHP